MILPVQEQSCRQAACQCYIAFQPLIVSFRLKSDAHVLPVLNEPFLLHIRLLFTFYSYWFQLLWLLLLFCSLILIATAHCRLCPYDILAQQMTQNMPQHY